MYMYQIYYDLATAQQNIQNDMHPEKIDQLAHLQSDQSSPTTWSHVLDPWLLTESLTKTVHSAWMHRLIESMLGTFHSAGFAVINSNDQFQFMI